MGAAGTVLAILSLAGGCQVRGWPPHVKVARSGGGYAGGDECDGFFCDFYCFIGFIQGGHVEIIWIANIDALWSQGVGIQIVQLVK